MSECGAARAALHERLNTYESALPVGELALQPTSHTPLPRNHKLHPSGAPLRSTVLCSSLGQIQTPVDHLGALPAHVLRLIGLKDRALTRGGGSLRAHHLSEARTSV
ncbi:hypothetical protein AOLI_G00023060 [Acnodon oligacanthus]